MIKQNIATFLFSLFAIICLGLSIYFINHILIFTIALAIGSLIFTLYALSEFLYNKNKNVQINPNSISTGVTINYSKLSLAINLLGYLILVLLGSYFISLAGIDYKKYDRKDYLLSILGLYFTIYYSIKFIKKLNHKQVLTINDIGITLNSEKMIWSEIKNEKIITKKETSEDSKSKYLVKYLSLTHKNKKIEFKIDDLDTPDYFIMQYLKLYKNRLYNNNFVQQIKSDFSIFENILKSDDLFSLNEKELNKNIENIKLAAKSSPKDLKKYCESISDFEENNLDSIYFALSEEPEIWLEFLSDEFIRLFRIAEKNPESYKIFDLLKEISPDFELSTHSKKVVEFLYHELSNVHSKIRLKALSFINIWLSEDDMNRNNHVIKKIVKMTKDENWKIRWCAHDILLSYGIFTENEITISFQDKMKAKIMNQYEIN